MMRQRPDERRLRSPARGRLDHRRALDGGVGEAHPSTARLGNWRRAPHRVRRGDRDAEATLSASHMPEKGNTLHDHGVSIHVQHQPATSH